MEPNENMATLSEYGNGIDGIDGWALEGVDAAELMEKMDIALLTLLLVVFGINPDGASKVIEKIEEEIHEKYLSMRNEGGMNDEQQTENRA